MAQHKTIDRRKAASDAQSVVRRLAEQARKQASTAASAASAAAEAGKQSYYTPREYGGQSEAYAARAAAARTAMEEQGKHLGTSLAEVRSLLEATQTAEQAYKSTQGKFRGENAAQYEKQMLDSWTSAARSYSERYQALQKELAEYQPYEDAYRAAVRAYDTYQAQEEADYQAWRATVRDADTIRAEQAELGKLRQELRVRMQKGNDYAADPLSMPAHEASANEERIRELQAYLGARGDRERLLEEELGYSQQFYYDAFREQADFAEKSRFTGADDLGDRVYQYINGNPNAGSGTVDAVLDWAIPNEAGRELIGHNKTPTYLEQMTDDEVAMYNYLYSTQGVQGAQAYLDYLKKELTARQTGQAEKMVRAMAGQNGFTAAAFSGLSALASPAAGMQATLGQIAAKLRGEALDPNASYNLMSNTKNAVRDEVAQGIEKSLGEVWGPVGSFGYQIGMSMADMLADSMSGNPTAAMVSIGSRSFSESVIDAKNRGLSDGQAMALGLSSAAAELLTEKLGLDELLRLPDEWKDKGFWKGALRGAAGEAGEEGLTNLANLVADIGIAGDKSEFAQKVEAYREDGRSDEEALWLALKDAGISLALDAIGGGISGAAFGGVDGWKGKRAASAANAQQKTESAANGAADEAPAVTVEAGAEAERPAKDTADAGEDEQASVENAEKNTTPTDGAGEYAGENAAPGSLKEVVLNSVNPLRTGVLHTALTQDIENRVSRAETDAEVMTATAAAYGVDSARVDQVRTAMELTGVTRVVFDAGKQLGGKRAAGWFDRETRVIHLNPEASSPQLVVYGHEMTHRIEQTKGYDAFSRLVLDRMADTGTNLKQLREEKRTEYAQGGQQLSDDDIDREIVAQYAAENLLSNEADIRALVNRSRTLGRRIRGWLDGLLARFGNKNAQERQFLERARDLYVQALDQSDRFDEQYAHARERDMLLDRDEIDEEAAEYLRQLDEEDVGSDGGEVLREGMDLMLEEDPDGLTQEMRDKLTRKKAIRISEQEWAMIRSQRKSRYSTMDDGDIPLLDFFRIGDYRNINTSYTYIVRNSGSDDFSIVQKRRDNAEGAWRYRRKANEQRNSDGQPDRGANPGGGRRGAELRRDQRSGDGAEFRENDRRIKNDIQTNQNLDSWKSGADFGSGVNANAARRQLDKEELGSNGGEVLREGMDLMPEEEPDFSLEGFSKRIDEVIAGKHERKNAVLVGATPKILGDIGLNPSLPMLTTQRHLLDAMRPKNKQRHTHGLTRGQMNQLPEKIKNPVMVMDSLDRKSNCVIVVTDMIDSDGLPIIAIIRADGKGVYNGVEIDTNFVNSYYGRNNFAGFIKRAVADDAILYVNKEKATTLSAGSSTQWLEQLKGYDFDIIIRKTRAIVKGEHKNTIIDEIDTAVKRNDGSMRVGTVQYALEDPRFTQEEVAGIQSIGRRSVNQFGGADLRATEKLARRYWQEMGVQSPFFRAWFGDWRVNDQTPVQIANVRGDARGVQKNQDTGWEIQISGKVFNETRNHKASGNRAARPYLPYINDIVRKAVLLDTCAIAEGKDKSPNSLLMHSLYAVADIGEGPVLLKLYVEEMHDPNSTDTKKRAYQLQNIEKQQLRAKGSGVSPSPVNTTAAIESIADLFAAVKQHDAQFQNIEISSPTSGKTTESSGVALAPFRTADIKSVADLFAAVKQHDAQFNPNPPGMIVDEAGMPRVMYHGTRAENGEFWVFDETKAVRRGGLGFKAMGKGNYFTAKRLDGTERYGSRVLAVYLNIRNPFVYNGGSSFREQLQSELGIDAALNADQIQQEMRKLGYDGVIQYDRNGEVSIAVAFDSNQIKSAADNVGTFDGSNSDIRYALEDDDSGKETEIPAAAKNSDFVPKMPVQVQRGLKEARNELVRTVGKALGVSQENRNGALKRAAEELNNEYIATGVTSRESIEGFWDHAVSLATKEPTREVRAAFDEAVRKLERVQERATRYLNELYDEEVPEDGTEEESRTPPPPEPEKELTEAEAGELMKQCKQAKSRAARLSRMAMLRKSDKEKIHLLLRGELQPHELDPETDNVEDILEVYEAKKEYEELAKQVRQYKGQIGETRRKTADRFTRTALNWKDKKGGFWYSRETMERNIRDIVDSARLAKEIIETYFTPVHKAEAAKLRFKKELRARIKRLSISTKVEMGNTHSESYAIQFLGEALGNIEVLKKSGYVNARKEGKTLREWEAEVAEFRRQNPNLDETSIRHKIQQFRKIYDELLDQVNTVRIRNGYEPVNRIEGYFPHFQMMEQTGFWGGVKKAMGFRTDITPLPTTINGRSAGFKPGIRWMANAQERKGFQTTYDAIEGFERYLDSAADVIYLTDCIQNLRAFAMQIRYNASDEGLQKQVDRINADPSLEEEQRKAAIERVYKEGKFTASQFVAELDEYTNLLAGKRSAGDREMERLFGRGSYNIAKWAEQRTGANMVAANIGSALTNFIPMTQGFAVLESKNFFRGFADTVRGEWKRDGFRGSSTFLTNRMGDTRISRTAMDKASEKAGWLMEWIDMLSAETITRGRYYQNLSRGMSELAAMDEADAWAAGLMGDRSKGGMPTLFEQTNPVAKLFTQFQLEVNNQFSFMLKDIPMDIKDEVVKNIAAFLLKWLVGQYLLNDLYERFIGRRPAFDVLNLVNEFVGDLTGYELPNTFEAAGALVKGEGVSFETEKEGFGGALTNLAGNVAEELPFTPAANLIGIEIDGGRVPVASAIPDLSVIGDVIGNPDWSWEKRWKELGDELAKPLTYLIPPFGGGQAKKAVEAASAYWQNGRYTMDKDGNLLLQFPMGSVPDAVQAALFGTTSTKAGREWVEDGFGSLTAKQTQAYKSLVDGGMDAHEAYGIISTLRTAEKTDEQSRTQVQRQLLMESGLTDSQKQTVYRVMISEDYDEKIAKFREAGMDMDDFLTAQLQHGAIKTQYEDEGDMATAFARWVNQQGYSASQKQVIRDCFKYWKMMPADADRYDRGIEAGLSDADAAELVEDLKAVTPLEGEDNVKQYQNWRVAIDNAVNEKNQLTLLKSVGMNDASYAKCEAAWGQGIAPAAYVRAKELESQFNEDGKGSLKNTEWTQLIDSMTTTGIVLAGDNTRFNLTNEQKGFLWQMLTGSKSTKNNPYSVRGGEKWLEIKEAMEEDEEG